MDIVSVLVFFFFLLVVVEARSTNKEPSCEQFSCGRHDYTYPFFNTTMSPHCRLFRMNYSANVAEIKLEESSGIWYKVKSVSQGNTMTITDPRLSKSLKDINWRDLSSFSLPDSPWIKDEKTLYKCDNTRKNGLTYANCRGGNSSYYFSKEDSQNASQCSPIKIAQSWEESFAALEEPKNETITKR